MPERPRLFHYIANLHFANCSLGINLNAFDDERYKTTPGLEDKFFFSSPSTFLKIKNQKDILIVYRAHKFSRGSISVALKCFFCDLKLIAQLQRYSLHLSPFSFYSASKNFDADKRLTIN